MNGTQRCGRDGCPGSYGPEGYCDECGHRAAAGVSQDTAAADPLSSRTQAWKPSGLTGRTEAGLGVPTGSGLAGLGSRMRGGSGGRGRLGAGLVDIPPVPLRDPAAAVLADPQVPENKRFCIRCDRPVGRSREGRPGRTEGFCPHCGHRYSFVPRLSAGAVVDDRYEILGALAHGGMGWIYLARDRHVSDAGSDRWVVLKGLIHTGDPDAMQAAMAERRFLVEVDHPNIVKIHDFATHPDPRTGELASYIVMEYVGGQSLKDLALAHRSPGGRREPLPLPQVLAYGLEILPALGHLHDRGLLFCDFKPDNVIHSEERLKLLDLGAVRRMNDHVSAIYGTPGYQAPDVATVGPTVESDLYTVGRSLAVLSFDFTGFSTRYADRLPGPDEVALFAQEESYYRLLYRATHPEVYRRFGSAHEMAEQLLGVLREVLSYADGVPRPAQSTLFTPERRVFGNTAGRVGARAEDTAGTGQLSGSVLLAALPLPTVDTTDPGAGFLATVTTADPAETIAALQAAPEVTLEVRLRLVRARIDAGELGAAGDELAALAASEPPDWRFDWYAGVLALAAGRPAEALAAFEASYAALPGEPAPKLALAAVAELTGNLEAAAAKYERVWRADHSYVSAAFGLARILLRYGDKGGAVAVLDEVPDSSSQYTAAQVAAVRARLDANPVPANEADLLDAAVRLERLDLDTRRHAALAIEVFHAALDWVRASSDGRVTVGDGPDPLPAAIVAVPGRLLGHALSERGLRFGLERAYRTLATLEREPLARYALVDRANAIRPRTLV